MASAKSMPKDAHVMIAILKEMGVTDYEPRVINQMLEFTYRYVTDILEEAKVYSTHANKKQVDVDDVKLAIRCMLEHSFTSPPPRDLLMDLARQKNVTPLPVIRPYTGPKLPPDRYCLSAPNYRLKPLKKEISTPLLITTSGLSRITSHQAGSMLGKLGGHPGITGNKISLNLVSRTVTQTANVSMKPMAGASTPIGGATAPIIRFTPGPTGVVARSTSSTVGVTTGIISTPQVTTVDISSLKRKHETVDDDYDAT